MVSRVILKAWYKVIAIVGHLSVEYQYAAICNLAAICQFKWDAAVSKLRKLSGSLCANPIFPSPYDAVDRYVDTRRAKVL